jgi:hypothetical protein
MSPPKINPAIKLLMDFSPHIFARRKQEVL